jgi:TPR repeat protein
MSVSLDHGALDGAERVPTAEELYRRGLVASTSGEEGALVLAHQWFNLAALQGNEDARLYRQQLTFEMSPAELAEAQKRAREWLGTRRAALAAV